MCGGVLAQDVGSARPDFERPVAANPSGFRARLVVCRASDILWIIGSVVRLHREALRRLCTGGPDSPSSETSGVNAGL